ncbi:TPA: DinI family protein [Klebsiella michiganensis]
MKIEVTIDKIKKMHNGAEPASEAEFLRRLNQKYDDCKLSIRRASADGPSVFGGIDGDKETIAEILQETWESADDWFF